MKNKQHSWRCVLALGVLVYIVPMISMAVDPGQRTFEKRCSQCHELPDMNNPPPEGWGKQLDYMAPMAGLNDKEKTSVLSYLLSHSKTAGQAVVMAQDQKLFEQKCSLCHTPDRILEKPLTAKSRQHIVLRMQKRASGWITPKDAEAILAYLSTAPVKTNKGGKTHFHEKEAVSSPRQIFHKRCSACHTLERVYLKVEKGMDSKSWNHIVQRMQGKNPEWLSTDEAKQIMSYLRSLKPVSK
ncbi:MAG: hypothetical protein GXP09_01200 [Gammaproteobacteria bacterium]|nr:hypothetical protein [Gammaproteobacteria bacterium]